MRRFRLGFLSLCVVTVLATGCGDGVGPGGDIVGGPCVDDTQCAHDSVCLTGSDFVQGTCALPCAIQRNCPGASACVDKEGGVCLLTCQINADCRPGYRCKGEERAEGDGEVLVCIE